MKAEPTASTTFTTPLEHLHELPALAPVDSYVGRRDYSLMNAQTSERILPPSEPPDCRRSAAAAASKWSPPFSVYHDQLTPCRQFRELSEPRLDSCAEAVQHHSQMSDYKGRLVMHAVCNIVTSL